MYSQPGANPQTISVVEEVDVEVVVVVVEVVDVVEEVVDEVEVVDDVDVVEVDVDVDVEVEVVVVVLVVVGITCNSESPQYTPALRGIADQSRLFSVSSDWSFRSRRCRRCRSVRPEMLKCATIRRSVFRLRRNSRQVRYGFRS